MKQKITKLWLVGFLLAYPLFSQGQIMSKFGAQIDLGYGVKMKNSHSNVTQLFISPFYSYNQNLSIGVGAGVMLHNDIEPRFSIPIYIHGTYKINKYSNFNPYFNIKLGYGFGSNNGGILGDIDGSIYSAKIEQNMGFFLSPGIGIKYAITDKRSIFVLLSYDLLKITNKVITAQEQEIKPYLPELQDINSTISFKIGYEF